MNTAWEERDTLIIAVQGPSGSDLRWHHDFLKWKPRRVTLMLKPLSVFENGTFSSKSIYFQQKSTIRYTRFN